MEKTSESVVAEETPLERKFKAWGAKSMKEVPRDLLNHKSEWYDREIFEKNLNVRNVDYYQLFRVLNENVQTWQQERYEQFSNQVEDYFSYSEYAECGHLQALQNRLDEIGRGLKDGELKDYQEWTPVIVTALKLPRTKLIYFNWASCHEDEGPTEPGLFYKLSTGEMQEVHYRIEDSEWCDQMLCIEEQIEQIIDACKERLQLEKYSLVQNEWFEIEVKWKKCRAENQTGYHTMGDLEGFARAFTDGLLKMSGLLPSIVFYERKERSDAEDEIKKEEKPKLENSQYSEVEKELAIYAKLKPSILRFECLCKVIADGISEACNKGDFEIWTTKWLSAGLQLLSEDPCQGSCNLIDRQNLYQAIKLLIEQLISLHSLYQSKYPDMMHEEMDYFYQAINNMMMRIWGRDPLSGKKGPILTPDFITREGIQGGWVFNNAYIRDVSIRCTAADGVDYFIKENVSGEDLDKLKSLREMEQSPKSLVMATYLVFCPAVESGEALLDSLGVSDEEQIKALLENRNLIAEIIQPFWGTYYDPYTQYSDDESEKDFKPELERLISRLNEIIEQIFQRLRTVFGNNVSIGEAEKAWRKVVALYNLRMKSPYVRLSCKEQERYRDIILEIIEKIASCAEGLVNEPKEDSKESSELQECEKIIKGVLEGISASPIPVKVDGFTEQGVNTQEKIIQKLVRKRRIGGAWKNQIDQAQVANDFGVSRQTVVRWEKKENPNGPTNDSNPWGYYSDLRKNPDLWDAYHTLIDIVKKYNAYKDRCKKDGKSCVTFVHYREGWEKHNKRLGDV